VNIEEFSQQNFLPAESEYLGGAGNISVTSSEYAKAHPEEFDDFGVWLKPQW
jgi:hypothetical protein